MDGVLDVHECQSANMLDQKLEEGSVDPAEIEDLFEQLEGLSDSEPDVDTISIGSTPKPSLKPFFCSSRNLLQEARAGNAAAAYKETAPKSHSESIAKYCMLTSSA